MVSYAWGRKYQQSNQWALETLALAMEPDSVRTRDQAQAWLQFKGYQPSVLKIGALTRLAGAWARPTSRLTTTPGEQRFADRIETVTVDSVLAWLPQARNHQARGGFPSKIGTNRANARQKAHQLSKSVATTEGNHEQNTATV